MHLFLNLQKTSLQDDLINRVVLYLLEDDDIRVRKASAKCLARYGHMITSLLSMQGVSLFHCPYHKCDHRHCFCLNQMPKCRFRGILVSHTTNTCKTTNVILLFSSFAFSLPLAILLPFVLSFLCFHSQSYFYCHTFTFLTGSTNEVR